MQLDSALADGTRPLTEAERTIARWLLEHGCPEAGPFLSQLNRSVATTWKCECGCASFNFKVEGMPPAPPGVHILADFMFGDDDDPKGIFIFEKAGILSGVELVGYASDAPKQLPDFADLRPLGSSRTT